MMVSYSFDKKRMNTITADKPFYGSLDPFFIVLWNYLRRRLVARRKKYGF